MGRDEQLPGSEEWLPRRCIYYQWICTGNFTQACLISVRVLGIKVLWNVTPCRWACRSRHIGRTYFLRLRGSGGHSIISFIVIPWIRTGLQNPYGYGNCHICLRSCSLTFFYIFVCKVCWRQLRTVHSRTFWVSSANVCTEPLVIGRRGDI